MSSSLGLCYILFQMASTMMTTQLLRERTHHQLFLRENPSNERSARQEIHYADLYIAPDNQAWEMDRNAEGLHVL
jgi:hypothetical protein